MHQTSRGEDCYAASKREEKKIEKYNHEVLPDCSKPFLIPALKHFGRWGQSGELFLDELAKKSRTTAKNGAEFVYPHATVRRSREILFDSLRDSLKLPNLAIKTSNLEFIRFL